MKKSKAMLTGAVEGGGTKFVCAVYEWNDATGIPEQLAVCRIPTTTPEATLHACISFFNEQQKKGLTLEATGIAMFGPLQLDRHDPGWGSTVSTPKPGWSNIPIASPFREATGTEVAIDTDVTAAAMAEYQWGAALHEPVVCYLTVGTGIGLGLLVEGRPLPGPARPEFGHIRIPHASQDLFPGICEFHGDCLEGLACGPALALRWGKPGAALHDNHPAWELEASYLAHACATLMLTLGNPCIVIGGGVGLRQGLLERIRIRTTKLLAGYGSADPEAPNYRIRQAALGEDAGLLGAALLAYRQACAAHTIA